MTRTFALLIALSLDAHAAENFVSLTLTLRQDMLSASVGGVGVVDRPHLNLFSGAWHRDIGSTIFWIGESARGNDPGNCRSAYLPHWLADFGGVDDLTRRAGFSPAGFSPRLNPFYVALPVQDVINGHTVPEARTWIPWSRNFPDGVSALKGHWVEIHKGNRSAFAQLSDSGPYHTDDWKYCFGFERLAEHANNDAGIDVSPAVRDYLQLDGLDRVSWRFVDRPRGGPWLTCGRSGLTPVVANNAFEALGHRRRCGSFNFIVPVLDDHVLLFVGFAERKAARRLKDQPRES